jgi:predicted nucleic acid-binding Zn ribbon protein
MNKTILAVGLIITVLAAALCIVSFSNYEYERSKYESSIIRNTPFGDFSVYSKDNMNYWNSILSGSVFLLIVGIIILGIGAEMKEKGNISLKQNSNIRRCPNCGRPIPMDAKFCPYCSRNFNLNKNDVREELVINTTFCPTCGVKLDGTPNFCFKCGYKLR